MEKPVPYSGGRGPRRQVGSPLLTKDSSRAVTAGTRSLRPLAEGDSTLCHFLVTFFGGKRPSSFSVTVVTSQQRLSGFKRHQELPWGPMVWEPPAPHGAGIGVSAGLAPGDSRLGAVSGPCSASRGPCVRQHGRRFGGWGPGLLWGGYSARQDNQLPFF